MAETNGGRAQRRRCLGYGLLTVCGLWMLGSLISVATSVRAYAVPTASMAPTLKPGDRIGVDTRPSRRPERGEVWVFRMPAWSKMSPNPVVKRVIGLPGETVEVAGGKVLIDGRPLDEPYLSTPMGYRVPPVTLGPDRYFVLGDNRNASHDSHIWGPLPGDHFIGIVKMRYWPFQRIGRL